MRRTARWPAVVLGAGCIGLALLAAAAWRLVEQERALDRVRHRERLENAASLVVRESERALAQTAADERSSITLQWDGNGMRRTGGLSLIWSPLAPRAAAPHTVFEAGEQIEFARHEPENAIERYRALLESGDTATRAGALLRIARCERNLGRTADAIRTYRRLAALAAAPAGTATAGVVGHHEAASLLESVGDRAGAARERSALQAALEQGAFPLDRDTFEFYAQGLAIDASARSRAEAVQQLTHRAAESAGGSAVLMAGQGAWIAEWSREGAETTGRLTDFEAFRQRLAKALESTRLKWQLLDAAGSPIGNESSGGITISKRAAETGLPWGVGVSVPAGESGSRAGLMASGALLLGLAILATLFLAYRTARREFHIAEMQSEFVAAVSHEFRTPITALTHLTEMLDSGEAAEDRKPLYYRALARETRRLRDMVENLLDFGRMESGRYRYKPEELDAAEFVGGIVEEFRAQPQAEGREVAFEPGAVAARVSVDPEAIRRAVWNLLDNAAKYSPPGSPIAARLSSNGGWTSVSVEDHGPGIAREEQKRIFQKFVRGGGPAAETVKGTGIGLAMVDAIARAHGGRVELLSRMGAGSCFTLVLPAGRRN